MSGGIGCGGILRKSLGIGLDSDLGIRVHLLRKPRLEAKPSQSSTGAGVLEGDYWAYEWAESSGKQVGKWIKTQRIVKEVDE